MEDALLFGFLGTFALGGLVIFFRYYPNFFNRASPVKKNPWRRERPLLINSFGIWEVVEREDLGKTKFALLLDDGYSRVKPIYEEGDIVPMSDRQVLSDESSPVFIEKGVKLKHIGGTYVDYDKEIGRINEKLDGVSRRAGEWEAEYSRISADIHRAVDARVADAEKLLKARTVQRRPETAA